MKFRTVSHKYQHSARLRKLRKIHTHRLRAYWIRQKIQQAEKGHHNS